MPDIATLGIRVENGDVIKATTSLNSMTVAGDKTEKATQRLTRRMALLEIEARQMDAQMSRSRLSLAGMAQTMGVSEAAAASLTHAFGALSAVAALGFIGRKTIEETIAAQNAMAQLEAAVKSTGGVAGRTVQQLDALSIALQKQTTFSDEAVKGAEAMLLTFDKIRGAEFDRATQAVADLATRMGGDLQTAAVQVGKALQDPTTGLTALRRSGVSFSAAQIEVIRKLYETGHAAEGQRVILAELEHQFGGSAAAARDTLGGALTGLKNAWGDLFEVSRGASQGTVNAINAITRSLQDNGLSMNQFILNTVIGWEKIKAAAAAVWAQLSTPIGPGWSEKVRAQLQRIDFDLSTKIAELNAPAKVGPALTAPKITLDVDLKGAKEYKKLMEELRDAVNDVARAQLDAQIASAKANADAVAAIQDELTQSDLLLAAAREGESAYRAQQREIEVLNRLTEAGITLSDQDYEAKKRAVEQAMANRDAIESIDQAQKDAAEEAKRQAEEVMHENQRRVRQMSKEASNIIADTLDSLGKKGANVFQSWWDAGKRGVNRFLADILGAKIGEKFGEMMGIGPSAAATKQVTAGATMLSAAQIQLQAAMLMTGTGTFAGMLSTGPHGGVADASVTMGGKGMNSALGYGAIVAGAGLTGYGVGSSLYSTSHGAFGNYARGALGGAGAGALAGATIGSVIPGIGTAIGATVGALVGFAAGIFGVGAAAKASAAQVREMRAALAATMEGLRAEVSKDALAQSIAQVHAQSAQIRQQIEDAYSGGGANSDTVRERNKLLAEANALEQERIRQLTAEAALIKQQAQEDLDVRTLRNQGREREAAILQKQHEDQRELQKAIDAGMSDAYLAQLRQNQAMEEAAVAAGTAADAINGFTTAVRNAPSGFKLEPYIQQYARALPYPGQLAPPSSFSPPFSPLGNPMLSRTGTVATAPVLMTFASGAIQIIGAQMSADEIATALVRKLDGVKESTLGMNRTRADALERMPA